MPSSGVFNLAMGLVLVFGATAALTSAVTEAVARLTGLRGAFLLRGLYELLDGTKADTKPRSQPDITLDSAEDSYDRLKTLIPERQATAGAGTAPPLSRAPSVTSALLGSPLLRSRGEASRGMTLRPSLEPGHLPDLVGSGFQLWRQSRRLPLHPGRSIRRRGHRSGHARCEAGNLDGYR